MGRGSSLTVRLFPPREGLSVEETSTPCGYELPGLGRTSTRERRRGSVSGADRGPEGCSGL